MLKVQVELVHGTCVSVSLHACRLSATQKKVCKIKKEALAVVWALAVNCSLLYDEEIIIVVIVADLDVFKLFTGVDEVTQHWMDRLANVISPFPLLQLVRAEENPALALGTGMSSGQLAAPAFNMASVMSLLFATILGAMKETGNS